MYFHKTNNNEIFLILNKEETIQKSLLTYGNFEHLAAKIALKFSNNSLILDIGANIGTPCIPLALGLPLAKIIAVEPQRNVFFHLCSNILVNKLLHKLKIIENNSGMGNVCLVPLNYLFKRGQGIKIYSLITNECMKRNFVIPVKKYVINDIDIDGYEGAIVLEPKEGIYLDDKIDTIKKKLLIELNKNGNFNISFYELYLFTKHNETINAFDIYQSLTLNEKMDLTQNKLNQYVEAIEN